MRKFKKKALAVIASAFTAISVECIPVSASVIPNPVISRNLPAYSGENPSVASAGNDEHYFSFCFLKAPDYLAYDLSGVSEEKKKQVIAVWYNTSSYDSIGNYVSSNMLPTDYTIEVNSAPGGEYPQDGWEVVETVNENTLSSRQHVVNMEGYNWIRLNVSKADGKEGSQASVNFDIHNVSEGISDSWIFFGDSITAGGMNNCYGTGFATHINSIDSRYFPIQENAGIGGITSKDGRDNILRWLADCPANYVSIAYGTNDAWGNQTGAEKYYENTKFMIDEIIKRKKTPILPKIPYATESGVNTYLPEYNAMIDRLYEEYGDKIVKGPDFEKFFTEHPDYLSADGVHPNSEGYEAMRKEWAETMYANVYSDDEADGMSEAEAKSLFMYSLNDNGTYRIEQFLPDDMEDVVIPSKIGGITVTEIGYESFKDKKTIKSVNLPDTLEYITSRAFIGCTSLKDITIPKNVIGIGDSAFRDCTSLEEIKVSPDNKNFSSVDGVLYENDYTLSAYPAGKKDEVYEVKEGTGIIGNYAFMNCKNVKEVILPSSLRNIWDGAFQNSGITKINIPENLTKINEYALNAPDLAEITADENNKNFSAENGVLFNKDKSQLIRYPRASKLTDYEIPASVKKIYRDAFYHSNIKEITVPATVEEVIGEAFCSKYLEKITFLNPECFIAKNHYTVANGLNDSGSYFFNGTVCGYKNSTAQEYAGLYGYNFTAIDSDEKTVYGDANEDGNVSIADAVLVLQSLANPDSYKLSEQGKINADVSNNGDGVTAGDALVIQQVEAGTVSSDSLPLKNS